MSGSLRREKTMALGGSGLRKADQAPAVIRRSGMVEYAAFILTLKA
jgi:hypothetical protein